MIQYMNLCSGFSLQVKINFHDLFVIVLILRLHIMSTNVPFYMLLHLRGHPQNILVYDCR